MRSWMLVVCSLFAVAAQGDTFGELKAAVGRLGARQAVRATYASEVKVKASGKFANEARSRNVSAEVAHDANGITISVPEALVDKASRGLDDAARNAIDAIRAMDIVDALDYRGTLLQMLNHASVAEEKRVAFRGKPARLLVLKLNMPRRKGNEIAIGSEKVAEDRLNIWIGDDNLPLAAERTTKSTAGFLFFHSDSSERTSITFAQAGDRLIVARLETSANGSGMGQNFDESSLQTVTVH
jgi:hypothetical protein